MISASSHSLKKLLEKRGLEVPDLHIVLGSGLAPAFATSVPKNGVETLAEISFAEVDGLLPSSAPGHKGAFKIYRDKKTGKSFSFQLGRLHGYEGHAPTAVVQPLVQMALAGTTKFLLTNASGSLQPEFLPGSLMVIEDHVNLTGLNPLYGPNPVDTRGRPHGPRFTDMSHAYDEKLNLLLEKTLRTSGLTVHRGTYLGVNGPTFETPAEVKLFSKWGLGAVGMSTVWETMAMNYLAKKVAGLSFISNLGCGLVAKNPLSHEEVEEEARRIAPVLLKSLFDYAANVLVEG
ncbi:MAG: purine-nucleoside phosphorylase [Bdellovibrionota bacterium]